MVFTKKSVRRSYWKEWAGFFCVLGFLVWGITLQTQAQPFTLTATKGGNGSGTVTGNGIDCGDDCSESFSEGTAITLHAEPGAGSIFTGWTSEECEGFGIDDCEFDIAQDTTVKANFDQGVAETFKLTVSKTGTGKGTVTSTPAGINCGVDCSTTSANFNKDTQVTLAAVPDANSDFNGWGGACSGTSPTCTVTLDDNKTVAATFTPKGGGTQTVQVKITKTGSGTGKVTSAPAGIDCGSMCSFIFNKDTQVTLTAAPDAASKFTNWSGACSGTATTCTLNLTASKNVTAVFDAKAGPFMLKVTRAGSARGLVTSNPTGINCGSTCSFVFSANTQVKLTANANLGYTFAGWGGACSGTATTCTVTMDSSKSVTATFNVTTDLSIAKTDSPDPASTATNITYIISITNDGPGNATGVKVTDPLPTGVSFVSAQASQGSCTSTAGSVQCTLGNVRADASAEVTIVVKPTKEGNVTNTASVSSETSDPNLSNNSASTTTAVGSPCTNVSVTSQPASIVFNASQGNPVKKNITVTILNRGNSTRNITALTPQTGEPFTIVSISPKLPASIRKGGSLRLIVQTQRAAGLPAVTATRPYFNVALDCGTYNSANESFLPILLGFDARPMSKENQFRAQVFTLAGRLLAEQSGDHDLLWSPLPEKIEAPLPNGVYLYVLSVRQNTGELLYREVQKIVVQR